MGVRCLEELQQQIEHRCSLDLVDYEIPLFEHDETVASSSLKGSSAERVLPLQI